MHRFKAAHAAAALSLCLLNTLPAQAAAVPGQGTWETTLQARDFDQDGNADAWYDTTLDLTWLNGSFYSGVAFGTLTEVRAGITSLTAGGFTDWRMPQVLSQGPAGCVDCLVAVINPSTSTATGERVYSEAWLLWSRTLGNTTAATRNFNLGPMGLSLGAPTGGSTFIDGVDRFDTARAEGTYELDAIGNRVIAPVAVSASEDIWKGRAWAVRSGDVKAPAPTSPIPEPETTAMMLAGLGLLTFMRRRQSRRR